MYRQKTRQSRHAAHGAHPGDLSICEAQVPEHMGVVQREYVQVHPHGDEQHQGAGGGNDPGTVNRKASALRCGHGKAPLFKCIHQILARPWIGVKQKRSRLKENENESFVPK